MNVNVYGAGWCTKTGFINNYLQSEWVDFNFYNVEEDEKAADYVRSLFGGKLKFPVVVADDKILLNPTVKELKDALRLGK